MPLAVSGVEPIFSLQFKKFTKIKKFIMDEITSLDKFLATPYRQEIELQQVDHEAGFSTLRLRIREVKRFTIFDIDANTAQQWGNALLDWAKAQEQGATKSAG
jgi:hypothetical protein